MATNRLISLFMLWIAALLTGLIGHPLPAQATRAGSQESFPIQLGEGEAALVDATIQIRILPMDNETDVQTGLGTLVTDGCHTYLFTHNHWQAIGHWDQVQILSAEGDPLLEMFGRDFEALIVSQDAGNLVLRSPLPYDRPAARFGAAGTVRAGDRVMVTYQEGESVRTTHVLAGQVLKTGWNRDVPILRLIVLDEDKLGPVDAGGGVWQDGGFIGNLWQAKPSKSWTLGGLTLLYSKQEVIAALSTLELVHLQKA